MAAAERRRGRRDNGLDASDWRAVDDLDPRVSEEVLELLRSEGIAAYVQPAVNVDPITRSTTLPNRPRDRLYVDRRRSQAAHDCLRRFSFSDPGGPQEPGESGASGASSASGVSGTGSTVDLDATFADIVAGFDRPVDATAATWPDAEGLPGQPTATDPAAATGSPSTTASTTGALPTDPDPDPPPSRSPVDGRHVTEPSLLDGLDALDREPEPDPDDQAQEKFVPPPPPPLPTFSRQTVLGALAVLAGLVLVIGQPEVLPFDRSATMLLGFAAMLGGATALISRLRPGSDPDDTHPDDGAKV